MPFGAYATSRAIFEAAKSLKPWFQNQLPEWDRAGAIDRMPRYGARVRRSPRYRGKSRTIRRGGKKRSKMRSRSRGPRFRKRVVRRPRVGGSSNLRRRRVSITKRVSRRVTRLSFADRVKRVVDSDKESPSGLYAVLADSTVGSDGKNGENPIVERVVSATLHRPIPNFNMYCPTGYDTQTHTSASDFNDAWAHSGKVFLPTQICTRRETPATTSETHVPDFLKGNTEYLKYSGASFKVKYLAVDWGWAEGQTFISNGKPYADCEIVFGYIKDAKKFYAMQVAENNPSTDPATSMSIIGKALGPPPTIKSMVFADTQMPARTAGTVHVTAAEEKWSGLGDRSKYRSLITVLKRVTYRHTPQVVAAADEVDGVKAVTAADRGKLWSEGTFKFPIGPDFKQERVMTYYDSVGAEVSETIATAGGDTPFFKKNIPFIYVRGDAANDGTNIARVAGVDPPARNLAAKNHMLCAIQWKLKIVDDE